MEGQMTIFDYIEKPKKEIGPKCFNCRYQVWLHKGGRGIQSCDLYGDCGFRWENHTSDANACKSMQKDYDTDTDTDTDKDKDKDYISGDQTQIDFDTFRAYCKHQSGSIVFEGDEEASPGCTFKDEKSATCWDDWQKCNEQNCPFMRKVKLC